MTKATKILTGILASAAFVGVAPAHGHAQAPSTYWGATVGPHLTGGTAPYDMTAADEFERMTGKRMSLMGFSLPWAWCYTDPCSFTRFPTAQMRAIRERGAIPVFSWASYSQPLSADQPEFRLSRITGGAYDDYLREWARDAKAYGHAFFLHFDWEMNLNGLWPYSEAVNGNRPGDYVKMWRHVHDVFEQEGADNVTWTWCPNISYPGSLDIPSLYPGDAYVDWTCIDGYNWGGYKWTPFAQMLGPTYDTVQAIAPTKPMIIGETASTEIGGSKAAWISDMLGEQLPKRFRNVKGVMWYEQKDPRLAKEDPAGWIIESSPSAQAAFTSGIAPPYYASGSSDLADVTSPIPPLSPVIDPRRAVTGPAPKDGGRASADTPSKTCVRKAGRTVCVRRCERRVSRRTGRTVLVCRRAAIIRALVVKPRVQRTLRAPAPAIAADASFGFRLASDATVTLRFTRRGARRWTTVPGMVRFRLTKGERGISFGGRLASGRALPRGTYRMTMTPVDARGRTGRTVGSPRFDLR